MAVDVSGVTPLLEVFDMKRAVAFYCGVLGFAVIARSDRAAESDADCDWLMLKVGDAVVMLNTAYEADERPASPEPGRISAHADAALFFACSDVDEAYQHLRGHDWEAEAPVTTHYGMKQVYTRDPDGFELCFQQPA